MTETFLAFARERGISDADIAKAIGRDRSTASRLRRGVSTPTLHAAARIQDLYGYPMRAWLPSDLKSRGAS